MVQKKGNLSIHSENIFPIIKKWLYSDHDIFIRELISNSSDAITKLKRLGGLGEIDLSDEEFKINVTLDMEKKQILVSDNGIGMTAEEIEKYINQIAFSGAEEFIEKYKDKGDSDQIIGHFGLGFYSAFMVSEKVTIDTLSYQEGSKPAFWTCDGGTEFTLEEGSRDTRGTTITLHLGEEGKTFENEYNLKEIIEKYCSFMPYPIYFDVIGKEKPEKEDSSSDEDNVEELEEIKPLNDIHPLYTKSPKDCTEEEYKEFYRKTFHDFKEPLFWIHLNMDYPFNLKGILYFPKLNNEFDSIEGKIKLYNSQVYIADNIKEVIPEFLLLLKGLIDCPDLPLNVSRSFLQNDGFVKKISDYITKKVADKLNELFKEDRENYEKYWEDINPFVKFGILKDEKFYDRVKDSILYKSTDDKCLTLSEYQDKYKEKINNDVYYVTDSVQQAQYINLLKENDVEAINLPERIDQPFISFIESKNNDLKFKRVDADVSDLLTEKDDSSEEDKKSLIEKLQSSFKSLLKLEDIKIEIKNFKSKDIASMIILSEDSRRMQDMMKSYGMGAGFNNMPSEETLVLNKSNTLVKHLIENIDSEEKETNDLISNQLYDLAILSHKQLSSEQMTEFIKRSNKILEKLI